MNLGVPENELDFVAYKHDGDYTDALAAGQNPYGFISEIGQKADDAFITETEDLPGFWAKAAKNVFKAKRVARPVASVIERKLQYLMKTHPELMEYGYKQARIYVKNLAKDYALRAITG